LTTLFVYQSDLRCVRCLFLVIRFCICLHVRFIFQLILLASLHCWLACFASVLVLLFWSSYSLFRFFIPFIGCLLHWPPRYIRILVYAGRILVQASSFYAGSQVISQGTLFCSRLFVLFAFMFTFAYIRLYILQLESFQALFRVLYFCHFVHAYVYFTLALSRIFHI